MCFKGGCKCIWRRRTQCKQVKFYLVHPPTAVSSLITPKQEVRRKLKSQRKDDYY